MKKLFLSVLSLSTFNYASPQNTCDITISWDTVTMNPCQGVARAYIEIEVTGGTPPYTFNWQGPNGFQDTSQNVYDLWQGLYIVKINDAKGCEYYDPSGFIVSDDDPIRPSVDHKNYGYHQVSCYGACDGSLIVAGAQGGYGDFHDWPCHWTGPNNFELWEKNISGLCPGQYFLELWDTSECYHKIDEESPGRTT